MSDKVWQEFYCGECRGYIRIKLNMSLNCEIHFCCPNPKCKHKHRRVIRDGQIRENGRFVDEPSFELVPTMSAYSKEPWTAAMKRAQDANSYGDRRDGVVVNNKNARDAFTENYMRDLWFERYGGNK